jgi:nucleoid-associated protein YgaU
VSKARKLVLALSLVVGGYIAALVLGGLSDSILPPAPSSAATASEGSWRGGWNGWLASEKPVVEAGQLVPAADGKSEVPFASSSPPANRGNQPTWLASSQEVSSTLLAPAVPAPSTFVPANHINAVEPPKLAESPPLEATPISLAPRPAANASPRARITEVRPVTAVAAESAASPWDRWPRATERPDSVKEASVPATFLDLNANSSQPRQAAYHESEVVRKNTPPRDPGAAPADALRTHIVIDGDTLTRLADRYLDDAGRASEIYRLNREVLADPELLPIGVELRIPSRDRPGDALAALDSASGMAELNAARSQGLVPVPRLLDSSAGAPRAQLMQPIRAEPDR